MSRVATQRVRTAAVAVGLLVASALIAQLLGGEDNTPPAPRATAPRVATKSAPRTSLARKQATRKQAIREPETSLIDQAATVAARYVEDTGSFSGNGRRYRRIAAQLAHDEGQGVRTVTGLARMRTRLDRASVQYANATGAEVIVSGTQSIAGTRYAINARVVLTRKHGRYLVQSVAPMGGRVGE